jgi:hypothetical protein
MKLLEMSPIAMQDQVLGCIEFEGTKMIGWIEDPNSDLTFGGVRLSCPLEFVETVHEAKWFIGFIRPELGVPREVLIASDCTQVLPALSEVGAAYRANVAAYLKQNLPYDPQPISRSLAKEIIQKGPAVLTKRAVPGRSA